NGGSRRNPVYLGEPLTHGGGHTTLPHPGLGKGRENRDGPNQDLFLKGQGRRDSAPRGSSVGQGRTKEEHQRGDRRRRRHATRRPASPAVWRRPGAQVTP